MNEEQTKEQEALEALESKKTGRIVLFALLAFFIVFASVDAYFVYKALSSNTGVIVENPYEQGLKYNEIIKRAKEIKNQTENNDDNPHISTEQ